MIAKYSEHSIMCRDLGSTKRHQHRDLTTELSCRSCRDDRSHREYEPLQRALVRPWLHPLHLLWEHFALRMLRTGFASMRREESRLRGSTGSTESSQWKTPNERITMADKYECALPQTEIPAYYALYIVDKEKLKESSHENSQEWETSGIKTVCCTLSSKHESLLRLFLVRRLRKGAMYPGSGTFSGMDFSIGGNTPAVCYYVLLPNQAIVCLLAVSEANIEVFRPELARFCEELEPYIQEPTIQDKLSEWYVRCAQYINHILNALGQECAALLQLVQQNGRIKVEGVVPCSLEADIHQFLAACSVVECLVGSPPRSDAILFLKFGDKKFSIAGVEANAYCIEWARLLLELGPDTEPWRLRKLLEAFKLKTIKDMNMLKRLLKQAETDHYFLYRAYSFLWQSGNSDVLLRQAALEGSSCPDVLAVLEEHLSDFGLPSTPVTSRA